MMEVQRVLQFHQLACLPGGSAAAGLLHQENVRCDASRWMPRAGEGGGRSSRRSRADAPCTVSWRCAATDLDRSGADTADGECSSSCARPQAWEAGGGRRRVWRDAVKDAFCGRDIVRRTSPAVLACGSSSQQEARTAGSGVGLRWMTKVVAGLALASVLSFSDVVQHCCYAEAAEAALEEAFSRQEAQEDDCTAVAGEEVEDREEEDVRLQQSVTSESVVEEAWEVVDEFFFDARHREWSREAWLKKKEEVFRRPIRSRMAAYASIRSMLGSLKDPYTRFLSPDQFSQLTKYDVTGIGLNVGAVADTADPEAATTRLKVLGIVLGSPAAQAGVRQGDELLSVDGASVVGKTAFEASSLIQGPKGTTVQLQLRRGPCSLPQQVTVGRVQDVRSPVFYRLQPRTGVGYIQVKELNAVAQRDLVTAMQRLEQAGATSLVLDLQDNPGGLVQAGIEIAKVFLAPGDTVVATAGRNSNSSRTIAASALSGLPLSRAPLTVLVNERTASASEIVAAALHDNCRALLVGRRTFGKGLIQSIYELSDGSGVVLTVGKYVTPARADIDGRGIDPDSSRIPPPDQAHLQLATCRHP